MSNSNAPGDGGFSDPVVYKTDEEMHAAYAKIVERDRLLANMTPAERTEYLALTNSAAPEDLES